MTIKQATLELLESDVFKEDARQDVKLRVYAGRIKKDGIKSSVALDLLTRYGYTITVTKKATTVSKK